MSSPLPVLRQVSWLGTIPQLVALGVAVVVGWFLTESIRGVTYGALIYLAYSMGSRSLLLQTQRRGMRLLQFKRYEEAVTQFEASYDFFSRHSWIDRYRSIVFMSPSAISFREMALVNIAFAFSQMGEGAKAKEYYRRTLDEFPESAVARTTLNLIESVEQSK